MTTIYYLVLIVVGNNGKGCELYNPIKLYKRYDEAEELARSIDRPTMICEIAEEEIDSLQNLKS